MLAGDQESGQVERVLAGGDGRPVPVGIDLSVLRDEHGRSEGVGASLHDLREQRDTERRRAEQEQLFAVLSARATDLAMVAAPDGTILYASPAATHVFGYDPALVQGLDGWSFVHPDDIAPARQAYDAMVGDGGTITFVVRVRSSDGQWRWVEESATNLLGTAVDGIVCNLRDVSDRVEVEQAAAGLPGAVPGHRRDGPGGHLGRDVRR